jgi:tRNA A37 threonylcarbamoyltransferase TsaD
MNFLAIETSCDETSVAIFTDGMLWSWNCFVWMLE